MKATVYLELQKKHQKEISEFPIAYAFSKEQLEEALIKLGVKSTDECVIMTGHGDIVKREDAPKFRAMLKRHTQEVRDLLLNNEDDAEAAFLYEMDNHEYAINWDGDDEVLAVFALDYDDLEKMNLEGAYRRARNKHMKNASEWGII